MRRRPQVIILASLVLMLGQIVSPANSQGSYVNFETSLVKPLAVSGDRLLVVHNSADHLVVYDLSAPGGIELQDEILVGVDPVSLEVRPGHPSEVWVVNSVSDDVSIVDLDQGIVLATIRVGDEPADVAFNGDGTKAYVTVGGEDAVAVVDVGSRTVLEKVATPGAFPRTIEAVAGGRFVLISSFKSGNKTTILPSDHPDAPVTNPQVGQIISSDDPRSRVNLQDADVFAIKTTNDSLFRQRITGLGTVLFSHAVHPENGKLYVTNTEALNLVQFEPVLKAHFIENRISIVEKQGGKFVSDLVDLNPHVNYDVIPDPAAIPLSLAQPTDLAFHPENGQIYVAAFGSSLVGVLSEEGEVLARIEVGQGPRGLVVGPNAERLFCLNHFDSTISEIELVGNTVVSTFPVGSYDPTPAVIREGRHFLYDARLSGNGTVSCASCHIDGDTDFLAWDLGDPNGLVQSGPPDQPGIQFDPRKGPMMTQTLRGLKGTGALHWRGDRPTFLDFNPAFVGLLGRAEELSDRDMRRFRDFVDTIRFAPNPHQNEDRSLSTSGRNGFNSFRSTVPFGGALSCAQCHTLPFGSDPAIIPQELLDPISQDFKAAKLSGVYSKEGRFSKFGFAMNHDGAKRSLFDFFSFSPPFPRFSTTQKRNFAQFVMEFDTGTAPSAGTQILVDQTNGATASVRNAIQRIIDLEIPLAHCDLIAHGLVRGERHGFFFNPQSGRFIPDVSTAGRVTLEQLLAEAAAGRATLVFKGVPVGSGSRLAIDRDGDCLPNGDEARWGTFELVADSDEDGWLDGWEVLEGSDPGDGASVPTSLTAPVIHSVPFTPGHKPYGGSLKRIRLRATGVLPGAIVEATPPGGGETMILPLFPTSSDEWTSIEPIPTTRIRNNARGWRFVLRNKTGASSPPFVAP